MIEKIMQKKTLFAVIVGFLLAISVFVISPSSVMAQGVELKNSCGGTTGDAACLYEKYINPTIALLSVVAGIAVVIGIIWGGIQYSSSAGDPQKVTKAKSTITKSLVGLVAFLLLGSFLQFLSPSDLNAPTNSTSSGSATTKQCVDKQASFLGLKAWYAYLPDGSFYSDCTVKSDIAIFPTKDKKSVLPNVLLTIADNLLRIAALVAVAFVIVGGVKYMTSQGQPNETKLALSSIINALIGLAIAMFAAVIVSFIGGALIK